MEIKKDNLLILLEPLAEERMEEIKNKMVGCQRARAAENPLYGQYRSCNA